MEKPNVHLPWQEANRYPGSCPTAQALFHRRVSAHRRQAEYAEHAQNPAQALLGQGLSDFLSSPPDIVWARISAPLRGLLKRNRIPKRFVGIMIIVTRSGMWGRVLI